MRQIILYPDETGYWVAKCPSLPGCVSQGETRDEAIHNVKDAIAEYIESLRDDGEPIPEDSFSAMIVAV